MPDQQILQCSNIFIRVPSRLELKVPHLTERPTLTSQLFKSRTDFEVSEQKWGTILVNKVFQK